MRLSLALVLLTPACVPLYGRETRLEFQSAAGLESHGGRWELVEVADAPSPPSVLMQTSAGVDEQFNLELCTSVAPRDADVRVQLHAVEGLIDQGGGLVWRARDARNYYLARWNPLEKNLVAFRVADGKRSELRSRPVVAGAGWHTLRVWFRGPKVEIWFDGTSQLEYEDAGIAVPGMIGLWTKADARTQFDDLLIQEL